MKANTLYQTKGAIIALFIGLFMFVGSGLKAGGTKKEVVEIKIKTSAVCGMCKEKIEKGLIYEKGIKDATLDIDSKIVTVKYRSDKTNPETIKKIISSLGYDADDVPADKKAYENLSPCCKKGSEQH